MIEQVLLPGDPLLNPPKRIAPCEQRLLEHLETLREVQRVDPRNFWNSLALIAKADYWAFLRLILQLRWMDPWWHGEEICGFLQEHAGCDRAIFLPRGTGKTTCITVPFPAWALTVDPLLLSITTNATELKGAQMIRATSRIISNNKIYRKCFPHIFPSSKWGKDGYVIDIDAAVGGKSTVDRVDSSFTSYGVGGNITGAHIGLLMHDDLINHKTYKYPVELRKAEDFFVESFNCLDAQGVCVMCATRWTYLDLYGKVESGELAGHHGPFKVMKRGIFKDNGDIVWPQRTFVDLNGNEKKSGQTPQQIANIKQNYEKKGQKGLFNALYLNEPVPEEDIEFDINLIEKYKEVPFELGPIKGVGVETESQAKALIGTFRIMMRDEGRHFRLDSLTSGRIKKETRIRATIGPIVSAGRLFMPDHIYRSRESIGEEMRTFDRGDMDMLDALTHCILNATEAPEGENPQPYIGVDPAFSEQDYSTHSAIVVGCWYKKDFWVLDAKRFQSERSDVIVRQVFRMYDKWSGGNPGHVTIYGQKPRKYTATRLRPARGANFPTSFEVDLPMHQKKQEFLI